MRGHVHSRMRSSRSGLKVPARILPDWAWRLPLASYFPSRTRRRGMRAKSQTPFPYASRRIDSLRRPLGRAGSLPYSMR